MKKKLSISFSIIIGVFIALIFLKDLSLKYILQKEASKALKQEVTIKYAHLNLISQNITISNLSLKKSDILVSKIVFDINPIEILKNKNINIDTLDILNITNLKNNKDHLSDTQIKDKESKTNNKEVISNKASTAFFKELTEEVAIQNNLSNLFSGNFNTKNITNNLSHNFFDFLIKNVDYIDIILEKELNKKLKSDIISFNKNYKDFIENLDKFKNDSNLKYTVNINNTNFTGLIKNINFNGTIKNISTNFSKAIDIPITINLSQKNNVGQIFGNLNLNSLSGELYIKAPKINLLEINNSKEYIKHGNLFIEQKISLNNNSITIAGETNISNLKLNKESIVNHLNTTSLNKSLILKTLTFVDSNITSFTANTYFVNKNDFITLKTSLPDQVKGILIRNKDLLNSDISKTIENHYDQVIEKKKNNFNNFIKKFKDIF